MLTSSASQYLHPGDYLQPLPTTLDAKKSPLALLAQTCSSIGKDSGPSKPIIPPIEKKDVGKDGGRRTESPGGKSTASSDGRKSHHGDDHRQSGSPNKDPATNKSSSFRTPPPKDIPPLVPVAPKSDGHKTPPSSSDGRNSSKPSTSSPSMSSAIAATSSSSGQSNSRISLNCGSLSLEVNHHESASHAASRTSLPPSFPAGKADSLGAHSLLGHSYPGLPSFLGHPGIDPAHYSSLAAHSALLAAAHHKPGLSPYVKYNTVKTASGATTLVPVCSDPYCTHCKLTLSSAQLSPAHSSTCGAGCTQCTHDKPSLPPHPPTSLSLPHALSSSSAALSSLYQHQPFSVLPGHHGLPYICNWVAGSDYCGKRFASSEELLQHLRTHTSSSEAGAAAAAAAAAALGQGFSPYSSFGFSASALAAASHSHLHGSLSPNSSLRAAAAAASYPRSMSPNSVLAAARYHPYSKSAASSLLPTAPPPSLGAYYPYAAAAALYSQRLGSVP